MSARRTRSSLARIAVASAALLAGCVVAAAGAPSAPRSTPHARPVPAAKAAPVPASADAPSGLPPGAPPMDRYQFGLLVRGAAWTPERNAHSDSIQAGHMANIKRMWEVGKLVAAGPFLDDGDLRGIFIFKADSIGEARALAAADPAIAAGRLRLDLWDWFAPAGIGEPYRERAGQAGFRDSMVSAVFGFLDQVPGGTAAAGPDVERDNLAHVQRIFAGLREGVLIAAGPLDGAGDHAGVFVCRPGLSVEAARAWWADDPHVKSGRLTADLHPWMYADGTFR